VYVGKSGVLYVGKSGVLYVGKSGVLYVGKSGVLYGGKSGVLYGGRSISVLSMSNFILRNVNIIIYLIRDIQDKYKMNLTSEASTQISKAASNSTLSHTIFIRTQYDVLRRLRAYWVPRFLIHQEHLRELR